MLCYLVWFPSSFKKFFDTFSKKRFRNVGGDHICPLFSVLLDILMLDPSPTLQDLYAWDSTGADCGHFTPKKELCFRWSYEVPLRPNPSHAYSFAAYSSSFVVLFVFNASSVFFSHALIITQKQLKSMCLLTWAQQINCLASTTNMYD